MQSLYFDVNGRLWVLVPTRERWQTPNRRYPDQQRIRVYRERFWCDGFEADYLIPSRVKALRLRPVKSGELEFRRKLNLETFLQQRDHDNSVDCILFSIPESRYRSRAWYQTHLDRAISFHCDRCLFDTASYTALGIANA